MKDIKFLEQILLQVTELYYQLLANQDKKIHITPEMKANLQQLTQAMYEITEMTEREMKKSGITDDMINRRVLGPKDQLPNNLKEFLEKSQVIKSQLEGCQNVLQKSIDERNEQKKRSKDAEKRKDKFKNIGAKKGWMPL